MKRILIAPAFFLLAFNSSVYAEGAPYSTADLDFLIGEWNVERVNRPGTENTITYSGTLDCKSVLSDQFIKCVYFFEREGRPPINDVVYFNYNSIYGTYESLWVSATWPIKVTMSAAPGQDPAAVLWESEFLIENGVREWVRSTWNQGDETGFSRRTDIRTSNDPEDVWLHWMNETVTRRD